MIAATVLLGLLLSRESGMDCCAQCGSYRDVRNWGLGAGSGDRPWIVILPDAPVHATRAMADFFPAGHEHEWRLTHHRVHGTPMLWTTLLCGGLYRNAFANAYEEVDALRTYVLGEMQAGRATRDEVLGMLHLSRSMPWEDSAEEAALRARAWGWMKAHAPEAPDFFMGGNGTLRDAAGDRGNRANVQSPK